METRKVNLTFCTGVNTVTGANFLFAFGNRKILIDCGLEQGSTIASERNREDFSFEPKDIDTLLITHAHIDHIGRIPKLVKEGFKGTIYSTPATRDLAEVMLEDAVSILEEEARAQGVLPLYEPKDVKASFNLWKTIPYHTDFYLGDNVNVYLKDSGHILGAAMIELSFVGSKNPSSPQASKGQRKIVFTGDLGNSPSLFLRDTDPVTDATYLVMESVYGDRNHEPKEERTQRLAKIIKDCVARKRTLLIPAFSLERTQDILFEINGLVEREEIGPVNVFLDSPLGSKVTEIYKKYKSDFKDSAKELIGAGDDIFNFPKFKITVDRAQSENITRLPPPKIIIAGSGMSMGGRVARHERHYLPDPNTTILLVGYQAVGTRGRQIQEGSKYVTIDHEKIKVRAEVENIMGYSSHKDSDHLIEFVEQTAKNNKKVFVVMGEPKAELFLIQRLRDYLGVDAVNPKKGETVEIEL
jgi:metallo-beta-lactamase family protein